MEKNQNPEPPIPLEEAIQQARYWREYCKKLLGGKNLPVIKAFFIPLEDLLHVTELAKNDSKHDVAGLRLYFRLENKDDDLSALKAMIVPVVYGTPDIAEAPLLDWPRLRQPNTLAGDSLVFDFTKPCPTECDSYSPLTQ